MHSMLALLTGHPFVAIFFIACNAYLLVYSSPCFGKKIAFINDADNSSVFGVPGDAAVKRSRRDGGVLSTPLLGAVVTGIIGMTAKAVSDLTTYRPYPSDGGCKWFGTAPLCNGHCQAEYDYIRSSNGRCSNWWFAGVCKPDPSFGEPCSTVLGSKFKKRFCCKSDPSECTWSGRWMGAISAHNIYCRYDNHGQCGYLDCSINHFTYQAQNSIEINGDRCDQISLFGRKGKATCGYIAWFDKTGTLVDSWYKTKNALPNGDVDKSDNH